jgi:hypothetical protein
MDFAARFFNYSASPVSRLALLKSPSTDTQAGCSPGEAFSASALMHDFSIWRLETGALSRHAIRLYLCRRCDWMFKADDRCRYVAALDQEGQALAGAAAAERLATFRSGPCPAATRLTTAVRLTQSVNTADLLYLRLIAVAASVCQALGRQLWRRSPSNPASFLRTSFR